MPDDMSSADQILAGGQADPNAPIPFLQQPPPPPATPQQTEDQFPYPGDPTAPPPAGVTATATPQPPITPAPQMGPIPQETQQHMGGIHRALNAVANLLGGPITYHMTTDKDGNVSIAPEPSTGGEKWGRIAANALGGVATGLANARGPGGFANATAAGIQYGLQQPQKQFKNQEQQADFQNRQLMFKANHAALDQKYVMNAEEMREKNLKFNQDQMDRYNAIQKAVTDAPGSEVIGDFDGINDLPSFHAKYPKAMEGHTSDPNSYLALFPLENGKTRVVSMNVQMGKQPMKDPPPIPTDYYDGDSHTIKTRDTNVAQGTTYNDYATQVKAQLKANSDLALAVDKMKGTNQPKTANYQETMSAASAARAKGDTAEADRLDKLAKQQLGGAQTLKETVPGSAAPGGYTAPPAGSPAAGQVQTTTKKGEPVIGAKQGWGGGDPSSSFEKTARGVYDGDILYTRLPPRGLKGQPTKNDYYARAKQIADDEGQPFSEEQIQGEAKYFEQDKVQPAFNAMDRLVGPVGKPHDTTNPSLLDQFAIQAKRAGVTSPQATVNDVTQALVRKFGTGQGQAEASALLTDMEDLRTNLSTVMGTPGLSGGLTDQKLRSWTNAYVPDMTLGSIAATNREIRTAISTERNAAFRTNRYLRSKYGTAAQQPQQGGRVTGYGPHGYGSYPAGTSVSQTPPTS